MQIMTCAFYQVPVETEEKFIKAAQEVNQLREEGSVLRQENLQLKVSKNIRKFCELTQL